MPKAKRIFYGWYIVAASIGMNFYLSVVFFQGFQVFFLPIANEFGWSRALTSGAFSLRQLESGLLAPVIGFLVDRWGPRTVILWSVIASAGGLIMLGYINSLWTFYVAFFVASLGVSGASHGVSWAVAVANWFQRLQGRALGIAMLGPVVGGPFVVTVAVAEGLLGWRIAVMLSGVGLLIVGIPLAMVARNRPERYGYLPDGDSPRRRPAGDVQEESYDQEEETWGLTAAQAVRTRDFWVLTMLFAVQFVGISGLMVHLIPLLEDINFSAAQAASILGLVFFLSGIGRVAAGFLADLLDFRLVMTCLVSSQAVALLILTRIEGPVLWQVVIFALLFGIGFGGTIPLRPFTIMRVFGPRAFGALQGLVQGGALGAGVAGPVFYGSVFDSTESYDLALYASVITVLVAIPLVFLLRTRHEAAARPVDSIGASHP
ncbi:MAG: MFS transporter [Chloroflexi bacterium]|nr:MFS transporter [Chloroflexota bacterium]